MPAEPSSDVKFEIGHVLFIDIVGYSKLLINEQSKQLQKLKEIVRGTEQVRLAEAEGKLLRLPTGDGGALVFRTSSEAPVRCALQISKALKSYPELRVRMGIHSGPVNEVSDLNEQTNIAGAGINIAQRVMDCGDAGHILLSKHVADDIDDYPQWRPCLHDLGQCEVKHGVRVSIVNLYDDEVGNRGVPKKILGLQKQQVRTRWGMLAAAVLLLAAIVAAFVFVLRRPVRIDSQRSRPSNAAAPRAIPQKSIAVLPFENLSRDPENAYFADGIQEEILTRLSKVRDLKVISRTSTQRFKSAPVDLRQIARQLGVANILEGTVQKATDQVRVNVQLINAQNDEHLWADKYDRRLTDIFAVESEIATSIATALQARLTGEEQHALSSRPTQNSEAHQFYLKGRYYWNKRTKEGLKKAVEYFEQAIDADPTYALAYVGLSDSYDLLGFHGYGVLPPNEAFPKAKAAAEKALQIDERLGEAHISLAYVKEGYDWDLDGAQRDYKRGIELNPNYAIAHQWYGLHCALRERFPEAIAEIKRAQELDPLSLIINMNVAWSFYFARQYDEALEQSQKALELDPNFPPARWMLGHAYRQKGIYDKAIAEFQSGLQLSGGDPLRVAVLGHAYAVAGKRAEAEKVINDLTEISKQRYFPPYFIALIYVGLNDKDQAFVWLEKAFAEHSSGMTYLKVEPMFDPIRSDPRFQDLLRRVGFTP
jgi:TolB-like protein/class 3 adenylate cyclase